MKNLLFLLMWIPATALAQQPVTVTFDDNKEEVIVNRENESISEFTLIATEEELNIAKTEAAKYAAYMTFETNKQSDGLYSCKLIFNHKGYHANVHKMLLTFGVEKFVWKGQTYSLDNWFNVFKN